MEYISEYRDNSCQIKNSSKQWHNNTSKPCNYILHQFGGLHKLWDSPYILHIIKFLCIINHLSDLSPISLQCT